MWAVDAPLPKQSRVGQGANFLVSLRKKLNRLLSDPIKNVGIVPRARQKLRDGIALRIALGLYGPEDRCTTDPIPSEVELANGRLRVHRQKESHADRVRLAESRATLLAPTTANSSTPYATTMIEDDDDDDDDDDISPSPPWDLASSSPTAPTHVTPFVPESPVADTAATTATAATHPIPSAMPMAQAFSMPMLPGPMTAPWPSLPPNPPDPQRASSLDHLLEQLPPDHPAVAIVKEPLSAVTSTGLESQDQRLIDQVGGAILERAGLKRQREKLLEVVAMQHNAQTALEMANTDLQQEAADAQEEHATKIQRVRDATRDAVANATRAALSEAQRVKEHHANDAETLRCRVTSLERELVIEKDRSNHLRTNLNDLEESSCCQLCNQPLGYMLNVNTGLIESKIAACTGSPGDDQHILCASCLSDIFRKRIDEGNLTNLPCAFCPVGGVFDLTRNLDLMSPGVVAKYHEVKIDKEVTQRTVALEAAAAANGGGTTVTLSDEELTSLPTSVQAELRRARAREHALADARTVKAPCCGVAVTDFDGCICIECDQCKLHWCALCFQVFSGDDEMHNHARREFTELVNDHNRFNLPMIDTYDYDLLPEAQRSPAPTELKCCPCHPHVAGIDPFFFTSPQQRAFVKKCWESRVLSQLPKPFEGCELDNPQGDQ